MSDQEESMKSMAFLAQADHNRKAAIYAAEHDGKLRNFAYTEELGECRETFSRLLHAVQEGHEPPHRKRGLAGRPHAEL
jgi:hypothetical protein